MSNTPTLVVCGSGKIKDKNVVALLSDHLANFKKTPTIVGVGDSAAAEYACRWAEEQDMPVLRLDDLDLAETSNALLVAWNDDDPFCFKVAEFCSSRKVGALDLCHGLLPLTLFTEKIPEPPKIPEQENLRPGEEIVSTAPVAVSNEEFEVYDEEDFEIASEEDKKFILGSAMDEIMTAIEDKIGPAIREVLSKILFGEEEGQ